MGAPHESASDGGTEPQAGASADAPSAERFLPVRKERLTELLAEDPALAAEDRAPFLRLCRLLEARLHHDTHRLLEDLKSAYAHFDPEVAARWGESDAEQKKAAAQRLARCLDLLLTRANYVQVPLAELDHAIRRGTTFKVGLKLHLEDFDEVVIYRRGESTTEEEMPIWFGLRRRRIVLAAYDRVCLFVRFKEAEALGKTRRRHPEFRPGAICLKLFHNIPRRDIEMLFPSTEVRMRVVDRVLFGVPAVAGVLWPLFKYKIGVAAITAIAVVVAYYLRLKEVEPGENIRGEAVTALVCLSAIGAYLFRQWNKFKSRKIYFLKILSDNLYYRNLDNGAGVLFHLLDAAEEAEFKEAALAYAFLRRAGQPLEEAELDGRVERWLEQKLGRTVQFECDDALAKLERYGLLTRHDDGRLEVPPLAEALRRLDADWDGLFDANGNEASSCWYDGASAASD